jgi:hypothetical protein
VTRYGLDGPGVESQLGTRFSAPAQTGPGAHPVSYTKGTGTSPGVKQPGQDDGHPTYLSPRVRKEYSYTSTPLWAFVACSRVNCTCSRVNCTCSRVNCTCSMVNCTCSRVNCTCSRVNCTCSRVNCTCYRVNCTCSRVNCTFTFMPMIMYWEETDIL